MLHEVETIQTKLDKSIFWLNLKLTQSKPNPNNLFIRSIPFRTLKLCLQAKDLKKQLREYQ